MPNINTDLNIQIKWAAVEQLDAACALQEKMQGNNPHPKKFFAESIACQRLLLAWDGETAVAYITYEVIWGNTAFLALLNVAPDYQRKSIGTKMVAEFEQHLIELGFKSYVTSSETKNQNTREFFPNLGFTRIGELEMAHGGEIFYLKNLPISVSGAK